MVNKKLKLNLKLTSNLTKIAVVCIFTGILIWSGFFLHKYLYQTIVQSQVVYILKNQIAISRFDLEMYNQVITKFKKHKNQNLPITEIRNPFKNNYPTSNLETE